MTSDVAATIDGSTIAAAVPFGTDVTALVATFSTTGQNVAVGGTTQVSDTTPDDFTSPVTYAVTAGDGSTRDYTVTVTIAPSARLKSGEHRWKPVTVMLHEPFDQLPIRPRHPRRRAGGSETTARSPRARSLLPRRALG